VEDVRKEGSGTTPGWAILFLDGFYAHLQEEGLLGLKHLLDNKILPIFIPSHTSHLFQANDLVLVDT
jgi:hypothetical protein